MKKDKILQITNVMPDMLKQFGNFVKDSFDKNGQDTIDDSNGVAGILIKLFAKDKIDKYFEKKSERKLENYGSSVYLQASLIQVGKSLEATLFEKDIDNIEKIINTIQNIIENKIETFDTNEILSIFQPKYHPIVVFVKENMKKIFDELSFPSTSYTQFLKDFNEGIESTIIECFGTEDYIKHKEEVKQFILNERESELLYDMYNLRKIGFKEDEDLKYEATYGKWENISNLIPLSNEKEYTLRLNTDETKLVLVEDLIEQYYAQKDKIRFREIVFIIADFGKGKSIFLKQFASKLAKEYIDTLEGYFPIYFNLRNYKNYQSNTKCGVIADFLKKEYRIDITSDEFKNKKYMFLIDSLDESGDLNKYAIDDVINSIEEIHKLDDTLLNEKNRILITSRPFDDGLDTKIKDHLPHTDKDKNLFYISVHGFKKEQFNNWIKSSLKDYLKANDIKTNKFTKKIVDNIKKNKKIDIYSLLIENETLTEEELKRPIFAYMVYQLIINNIDFSTIGKTGVYLSFLNLLTKEAKHIDDKDNEFNLKDEIESRNVLHAISALWMYEKHQGRQGTLKKADIFRVLENTKIHEDVGKILEKYKDDKVSDIKFLSHSYFGAKDDLLHFQHQSFAEMLLAEYYLKIFIKFALDDNTCIQEARILLNLGEPTAQTMEFFKELLQLLKDSCNDKEKEKRKLLFPLLASLATEKHNKNIRCDSLWYEWLKPIKLDNLTSIPERLLDNWCINDEKLSQIINLAKQILESKNVYLTTKASFHKALFDSEVIEIETEKLSRTPHNIDKWMALLVGNILYTDIVKKQFFNSTIDNAEIFFEIIKDWAYIYNTSTPQWAGSYFIGLNTTNNNKIISIKNLSIENVDFSFSIFKLISFENCIITNTIFNSVSFIKFDLFSRVYECSFKNIVTLKDSMIFFVGDELLSPKLMSSFFPPNRGVSQNRKSFISIKQTIYFGIYKEDASKRIINDNNLLFITIFEQIKDFLFYGLKEKIFTVEEIIDAYEYNSDETKELFFQEVKVLEDSLK